MRREELTDLDVATLSAKLKTRELSAIEVTDAYLEKIANQDRKLGSFITVTADAARAAASAADRAIAAGNWKGAFHGIPIGLKDNIYTKGLRTTGGSNVLADFEPDFDATVWTRLCAQGAVLLGKQNLNEFAYGGLVKACRNPYDKDRLPGGSSAGPGVAVAARLCAAAIGTDTSGSIRIPAAQCGCVGLKPTYGRVSRHGVIPLAYTMDHVGPLTRTVRDAALMLNVIAGGDPNDGTSSQEPVPDFASGFEKGVKDLRIGVIRELTTSLADDVSRLFQLALKTLQNLGAAIDEVSIPAIEVGALINSTVTSVEALDYHESSLRKTRALYGKDTRINLETGMMIPGVNYFRAQRGRARLLASVLHALKAHDVLVTPGAGAGAVRAKDYAMMGSKSGDIGYRDQLRFTQPFNSTGQPALVVPMGIDSDGLPASIQFVGRPFDEATLFRVALAYETARGPLRPPPI